MPGSVACPKTRSPPLWYLPAAHHSLQNDLVAALMLEKYVDKYSRTYSGGNKRKLSTAIAMIGDPPVIFLDEPTTGMDPGARRFLWDRINETTRGGRCVVLTSHSMEECEALCTRLAIMVNGRFQCIGSPQQLKTRFGHGYSLTTRVSGGASADTTRLKQFLSAQFECRVKEEHQVPPPSVRLPQGYVKFIVSSSVGWATLFQLLESAKDTLGIEDYSVSQTTLEQVGVAVECCVVTPFVLCVSMLMFDIALTQDFLGFCPPSGRG
jgi:ATP-binding cassette subfamily A (ABC1) protein 3